MRNQGTPSLRCGIFSRLGNTRDITDMEGLNPEKKESTECIMNDVRNNYIMMFWSFKGDS